MKLAGVVAAVLLIMACPSFPEDVTAIIKNGSAAPVFMLPSLDNETVSLRDFCGNLRNPWKNKQKHIVILSFMASYCVPCRQEIPQIEAFIKKAPADIKVIFISVDSLGEQALVPFRQQLNMTQTILMDRYGKTMNKYGVKKLPSLFIVDKEGVLRFQSLNGLPVGSDISQTLIEQIEKIRKEGSGAPAATGVPREVKLKVLKAFFSGKNPDDILKENSISLEQFNRIKAEAVQAIEKSIE